MSSKSSWFYRVSWIVLTLFIKESPNYCELRALINSGVWPHGKESFKRGNKGIKTEGNWCPWHKRSPELPGE